MSPTAPIQSIGLMHDPRLQQLREITGKVIGSVFYETLLRTMRGSPLRGEFGHGGYGEEVFQGQLDTEFADRAGRGSRNALRAALLERLAAQQLRIERGRNHHGRQTEEA